jgi:hypothetical protein
MSNFCTNSAKPLKTYICGCVKDCEKHIPAVFENIKKVAERFDDYHIVMAFDQSKDQTLRALCDVKKTIPLNKMSILINKNPLSHIRTQNIANARNVLLEYIRTHSNKSENSNFDYFIMIDMDDVCAGNMDGAVLDKYMDAERTSEPFPWDCLTFNRPGYYDAWALSIEPFVFSCWNFPKGYDVVIKMRKFVEEKLNEVAKRDPEKGLLPVMSAFNGFAIYRRDKFIVSRYEWENKKNLEIIPMELVKNTAYAAEQSMYLSRLNDEDCEHRYFHIRATQLNGARICISPLNLFTEYVFA